MAAFFFSIFEMFKFHKFSLGKLALLYGSAFFFIFTKTKNKLYYEIIDVKKCGKR